MKKFRILGLVGSPRKEPNTYRLAQAARKGELPQEYIYREGPEKWVPPA